MGGLYKVRDAGCANAHSIVSTSSFRKLCSILISDETSSFLSPSLTYRNQSIPRQGIVPNPSFSHVGLLLCVRYWSITSSLSIGALIVSNAIQDLLAPNDMTSTGNLICVYRKRRSVQIVSVTIGQCLRLRARHRIALSPDSCTYHALIMINSSHRIRQPSLLEHATPLHPVCLSLFLRMLLD